MNENSRFYIGIDLGMRQDYSAIAVIEKSKQPTGKTDPATLRPATVNRLDLRHLHRFQLGTPYSSIVDEVAKLAGTITLHGQFKNVELIVDATGVGTPVVEQLERRKMGVPIRAVTITGGNVVSRDGNRYSVPKRDLVSTTAILLQGRQLRIAASLAFADTLQKELLNFKLKVTAAGNDTYEAWREGDHDDLVLAVALACWKARDAAIGTQFSSAYIT